MSESTTIRQHIERRTEDIKCAVTGAIAGMQDTISDLSTIRSGAAAGATAYQKPANGIPENDMSPEIQASLRKADTSLQEHQSLEEYYTKSETITLLNEKQDVISDLSQIRSRASVGAALSGRVDSLEDSCEVLETKIIRSTRIVTWDSLSETDKEIALSVLGGELLHFRECVEEGWYVTDADGYIGMCYTSAGFDTGKLSEHFKALIKAIEGIGLNAALQAQIASLEKRASVVRLTAESGIYITDSNGYILCNVGSSGSGGNSFVASSDRLIEL